MASIGQFFGEVKREIAKVTWPTRKETMTATIMVLVMAIVASIFFFTVDRIVGFGIREILMFGKS